MNDSTQHPIDFVVTWVNGNDPVWAKKKAEFTGEENLEANTVERYRDWGIFKYWFRGVERFAPWVRYVWLITDEQIPQWLRTDHPKLRVVDHKDFIPQEFLPTFQSNAIEINLHRIKGLAEHFVYFNDDVLLINHVSPEHFFRNGLPCDSENWRIAMPCCAFDHVRFNNIEVLNRHFSPRKILKRDLKKWIRYKSPVELFLLALLGTQPTFSGFSSSHICIPFLKSTFETVWEKEYETMYATACNRLRTRNDVSVWLVRYWQFCEGKFIPQKPIGRLFHTCTLNDNDDAVKYIKYQRGRVICINDCEGENNFELHRKMVSDALDSILPDKSEFEI